MLLTCDMSFHQILFFFFRLPFAANRIPRTPGRGIQRCHLKDCTVGVYDDDPLTGPR
jgi:hypothetical protein